VASSKVNNRTNTKVGLSKVIVSFDRHGCCQDDTDRADVSCVHVSEIYTVCSVKGRAHEKLGWDTMTEIYVAKSS
jgi:hypothetical protein